MSDIPTSRNSQEDFDLLIEKLVSARALGRSPTYQKLLNYLAEKTLCGAVCSEYCVAIDVFEKDAGYDVTADSTVRVYIHNLRKKLEAYYTGLGEYETKRLSIPKGEYRLMISDVKAKTVSPTQQSKTTPSYFSTIIAAGLGALLGIIIMLSFFSNRSMHEEKFSVQQSQFWGGILTDDKPVMIVLGDYFIFAEQNDNNEIRLVREFDINSAADLRHKNSNFPDPISTTNKGQFNLGLTYLPRGSAYAVAKLQQLLQKTNKTPRIHMMSEFSADDLRANHIIYIGYLSGLGVLENYVFNNSRFDVGVNYDSVIDIETGKTYRSDFIEAGDDWNFTDFGALSSFSVDGNNKVVALTGTRDAGLMEMSDLAISPNLLSRMQLSSDEAESFEALFSVNGFNLTNVTNSLIVSGYKLPTDASVNLE